ncbi:ATP-binding protein [Amycolatopsis rifamycinica]|uniref:Histidine kinase/HSP90-like ATPase domain-containing protein n=1 Tax=Amycolatopsis rifamycinica TaxID=287986 RepID=A0A066UIN5_9PSEU|nr:ATP-binding protein [Amycolatopsis rifamycinica]KDN24034.1 hypothetical protein DV20_01195 [Amycolatopsis rifamycinica]
MDFDQELAAAAETTVALGGRPDLRRVRSQVAEALASGSCPGGVLLVIDELVGNAYEHATAVRELHVTRTAGHLLIEVGDRDPDLTSVRACLPGSGRYGLRLVDQLTLDWGVRADHDGKVVWALVPLTDFPVGP